MPLRRVLFNVPGSDEKKIQKALGLDLDCLVFDFEDGVAQNQKSLARKLVSDTLRNTPKTPTTERLVRVNSVGTGLLPEDLEALEDAIRNEHVDSLVIPKVESKADIEFVTDFLDKWDSQKRVQLLVTIESAKGVIKLSEITEFGSQNRVTALVFGSEDFCADMGLIRTIHRRELLFARSSITTYAHAYKMQAIDLVCIHYKDESLLREEASEGFQMGFHGKQAIHPSQIQPIYDCFAPNEQEVTFAKRIVDEYDGHQEKGTGAFSIEGVMVDAPLVKWAKRILSVARKPLKDE